MVSESARPLRISVVGHTNTGKTSLLRTLTRDVRFGQVSMQPSTTRHVEAARLLVNGQVALELYDTPGMEDSVALLEFLEQVASDQRLDGPARVERFLGMPEAGTRFEQEAKVLRQMLRSDAAFYVVDARDPVLSKHRDELTVLGSCGVPLLPLLNFVSSPEAQEARWREALGRAGLHAVVCFDTVAPLRDAEELLYGKLATLLDAHREVLQALIANHRQDAAQRHSAALSVIAEMLIDVAAAQALVVTEPASQLEQAIKGLNRRVREREQLCVSSLLSLYSFLPEDLEGEQLPLTDGRWEDDLFDPETLQLMGIKLGGGAAAGAATGFGIDLMVGGMSLGAATVLGAVIGGGWQTLRHYGRRIRSSLLGEQSLRVDDSIIRLLAARQLQLLQALENRGHAAVQPVRYAAGKENPLWRDRLPAPLRRARDNPHWSALYREASHGSARHAAVDELVAQLET